MNVALLGCGRIARILHLPLLLRTQGVRLHVVAEPDAEGRAIATRAAPVAMLLDDWRDAVADPAVDAVVVTLSNALHAEAACAAFEAGKHVYLEKPIATTLYDAERVVEAWRASDRVGMMGFQGRFDPIVLELKETIARGGVGRVVAVRIAMGGPPRDLPAWKRARATGGGALLDQASHAVDLARFFFGCEVASVSGSIVSARSESDTASCAFVMENGTLVQVFACLSGVQENVIEVVGERGIVIGDRYAREMRMRPATPPFGRKAHLLSALGRLPSLAGAARRALSPPDHATPYRRALAAFARAASDGVQCRPDLEDGLCSLAVILAVEA